MLMSQQVQNDVSLTLSGPKLQGLITREQQDMVAAVVFYSNQQERAGEVN